MNRVEVQDLWDEITKIGMLLYSPDHPNYLVVGVLNSGDGPDEVLLNIDSISWDHDLGVLRLELEAK